jgi:hypothetical protein
MFMYSDTIVVIDMGASPIIYFSLIIHYRLCIRKTMRKKYKIISNDKRIEY